MILNLKTALKKTAHWVFYLWKRMAFLFGTMTILLLGLLIFFVFAISRASDESAAGISRQVMYQGTKEEIAIVRLSGEITTTIDDSFLGYNPFAINPRSVHRLVMQLMEMDDVQAVLLVVNSPGGSVAAAEEVYQQINLLANSKPTYAYFEEVAASGGYYIALPSQKIMASVPTLTGSIGVIAYDPDISGLMEKVGVNLNTYQSGALKDLGSPTRSATDLEREIFDSIIDDSYQLFIDRIEANRPLERDRIIELADGRIYSGKQAQENGLIDEISTFNGSIGIVAAELGLEQPTVVEYSIGGSWWTGLFGSGARQLVPSSVFQQQLLRSRAGLYYL